MRQYIPSDEGGLGDIFKETVVGCVEKFFAIRFKLSFLNRFLITTVILNSKVEFGQELTKFASSVASYYVQFTVSL